MKRDNRHVVPNTVTENANVFNDVTIAQKVGTGDVPKNVNVFNVVTVVTVVTPQSIPLVADIHMPSHQSFLDEKCLIIYTDETVIALHRGIDFYRDNRAIIFIYLIYIYKRGTDALARSRHGMKNRAISPVDYDHGTVNL